MSAVVTEDLLATVGLGARGLLFDGAAPPAV
jgi:hypothetical protein